MRDLVATCRGEWPKTSMWPLVGYSNPRINFTVVDLPEPLGPSRPKTSPWRTSKSTLSTARALGRPQKSLKTLVRPRTETMGSPGWWLVGDDLEISTVIKPRSSSCHKVLEDLRKPGFVQPFLRYVNHCVIN